jgi:SOS response regulatory protein OraA/RecX
MLDSDAARWCVVDEIYTHALKLLRTRDYTIAGLRKKLETKFGSVPEEVLEVLISKKFLNDRRFAENYATRRKDRGAVLLRQELIDKGVETEIADEILSNADFPSLKQAVADKMTDWQLRVPLQSRDAARLFRALVRLGYDEDAIREEIDQIRER